MDIETRIRPICDALNAAPGVRTLYSCEGHFWKGWFPYVMFESTIDWASQLDEMVQCCVNSPKRQLFYFWQLTGTFSERNLRFTLSIADRRLADLGIEARINVAFNRRRLDSDIKLLGNLVRNTGAD